VSKRLLLIGGGHSHVEVIRRFGTAPEPGIEVTLVSPGRHAPYSGMLPGHIAGHYSHADCHIDLDALCRQAGVYRIDGAVDRLDLEKRVAACGNAGERHYDVLSIDTGSTPAIANIAGASDHGIPVKPVAEFLQRWEHLRKRALSAEQDVRIAVVGAGAAGVEVLLSMQYRITTDGGRARFTLVSDGPAILASHPGGVRRRFANILRERGVAVRLNSTVDRAGPGALQLRGGDQLPCDEVLWITGAAAPAWPAASGLRTDAAGFILVNAHLQSLSHPQVFAAGDMASMLHAPRPKSGVYAVRQGPPLTENLRHALRGTPLVEYRPQQRTLALISSGNRHAVASWGPWAWSGAWVWRWKDRIDRAFVARYRGVRADRVAP
jgi:selenide, water dikinase